MHTMTPPDFTFLLKNDLIILLVMCVMAGLICCFYIPAIRKMRNKNDMDRARRYTAVLISMCLMLFVSPVTFLVRLLLFRR